MGGISHATFFLGLHAEILLAAGYPGEALARAERALGSASQTGERAYLPRLYRVRAEMLLQSRGGSEPEVEASLQQALAVAREQDAKGWEINAASDLARLWAETGRRAEAQELLAPVYNWFTEGFDTPLLQNTRAVLDAPQLALANE
jgi:predicted ATPase